MTDDVIERMEHEYNRVLTAAVDDGVDLRGEQFHRTRRDALTAALRVLYVSAASVQGFKLSCS